MAERPGRIAPGVRIRHSELGPGIVVRCRRGGRTCHVRFDANPNLVLEVGSEEVRVSMDESVVEDDGDRELEPVTKASGNVGPFKSDPEGKEPDLRAALVLEALRTGVVPRFETRRSSVGRDVELGLVRSDLEQACHGGAARVFLGDYGSGKTHMLELVEQEAVSAGFLVGKAILDPVYVTPSQPMRIYRQVVSSLVYPQGGSQAGLMPLLLSATRNREFMEEFRAGSNPLSEHLYLKPALHYISILASQGETNAMELVLDWISGHRQVGNQDLGLSLRRMGIRGPTVYSMKDFQPWAHVYSYILSGISVLARRMGYSGLVVMLDEAENYDLLGSSAMTFADSTFRCLALASLGKEKVCFREDSIVRGGFPPQKKLPYLFHWPHSMYLVCAMTPSTHGESLLRSLVGNDRVTELTPLKLEHYRMLSHRVAEFFQRAYPEMSIPERLKKPLGQVLWTLMRTGSIASPRDAAKLSVEFLDLVRLSPSTLTTFFDDLDRAMS